MQYKTIIHEWIQSRPSYHDQLAANKQLLSTMNELAIQLRNLHLEQLSLLQQRQPNRSVDALKSEALEIALQIIEETLPPEIVA